MRTFSPETEGRYTSVDEDDLRFLEARQIFLIDEALASLGEYGEVHLCVEKGRLRYVTTQNSIDVLKWQPGSLHKEI
jgi:hypothetical protein